MPRARTRYSVQRTGVDLVDRNFDTIKTALDGISLSSLGIKALIAGTLSTEELTGDVIRFLDTPATFASAGVTWTGTKTAPDGTPDTMQATVTALGGGAPVGGSGVATRIAWWSAASTLSSSPNLYWDNVNTRLGVGTSAPGSTLHLSGTTLGGIVAVMENLSAADGAYAQWFVSLPGSRSFGQFAYSGATTGNYITGVPNAGLAATQYSSAISGHIMATTGTGPMYWSHSGLLEMQLDYPGQATITYDEGTVIEGGSSPLFPLRLRARASPVRAANFGPAILFQAQNATGPMVDVGTLQYQWTEPTAGAEASIMRVLLRSAGGVAASKLSVDGLGILSLVPAGGALEFAGSSPAVAVSAAGQVRQRNNAGVWQASQVAAAYRAASPLTTKGDLFTANATDNVRLAVGAETTVLVSNAAAATGQIWQSRNGHLSWGCTAAIAGTRYLKAWDRSSVSVAAELVEAQIVAMRSGTLGGGGAFRAKVTTPPGVGNTHTFTLRINGVATTIVIVIAGLATTGLYVGGGVAVAAGDFITCQFVRSAAAVSPGQTLAEAGY